MEPGKEMAEPRLRNTVLEAYSISKLSLSVWVTVCVFMCDLDILVFD